MKRSLLTLALAALMTLTLAIGASADSGGGWSPSRYDKVIVVKQKDSGGGW